MNQVLELYKNALDRLTAAKNVDDKNQQKDAISYTINSIANNPLVSEKLANSVNIWERGVNAIPDNLIGPTVVQLHSVTQSAYNKLKAEVDEDAQLVQQPPPADNPALSPAENLRNLLNIMVRMDSTISRFKWASRIAIEKINANQNAFAGEVQAHLPFLAQVLQEVSSTHHDDRIQKIMGAIVGLKHKLFILIARQQQNDVNMAVDGGRKKRRGKKSKKVKKNRRYTRRR